MSGVEKRMAPDGFIAKLIERVRSRAALAVGRRRWLMPAGVVAALLLVTVVVPGYIASQPKFLERYPSTQKYYLTWSKSTHAEVTCQSCHVRPSQTSQALHDVRMLAEFYLSIVAPGRSPQIFGTPPNESCQTCHYANRTASPSGDLKIPHRAHVIVLGLRCVRCHKYAVHFKNPEGTHSPRMATCLVCHDGKKAKNACSTCHKRKSFPVSHRSPDWLVVHPKMQSKINCKDCHGWVRKWCRQCHEQRPRSHTGRWRALHGFKVAAHRNCEACHAASFCVRCHGEMPALNRKHAPKFVR